MFKVPAGGMIENLTIKKRHLKSISKKNILRKIS